MDDTTIRRLVGNGKKGKKMPREMSGSALFGADPATYAPVGGALTGGAETGGAMTGGAMTSGSLPIYGSAMTGGAETGGALTGGKFQAKDLLPLLPLVFGLGKGEMEGALERIYGGAMTGGELAGMQAGGAILNQIRMEGGAMTGGAMTGGALTGAGFFQDFARGFKKALGAIGSVASKVAPVLGAVPGLEELAPIAGAVGAVGKAVGGRKRVVKRRRKSKATGARAKRNALVRKIMRERGVSLPQASRIIKEEGLM